MRIAAAYCRRLGLAEAGMSMVLGCEMPWRLGGGGAGPSPAASPASQQRVRA
jgi:hypothetical protein